MLWCGRGGLQGATTSGVAPPVGGTVAGGAAARAQRLGGVGLAADGYLAPYIVGATTELTGRGCDVRGNEVCAARGVHESPAVVGRLAYHLCLW